MKNTLILILSCFISGVQGQAIVGTWQLTEEKTCFQTQFEKSSAEKELEPSMGGSSRSAVAKLITFNAKGEGEEGIFSAGKKRGSSKNTFRWKIEGTELQFLDKKSGIVTQRFILDELGTGTLRIHDAVRDCEVKVFSKVK
jgi:hypothetical protein